LSPSGNAFDCAIRSVMLFGPVAGLAITTIPTSISLATGARSRSRSGAVEFGRCGLISRAPVAPTPSVSPSGGDFATVTRPSETPAPVLFSTTTVLPVRSLNPLAIARAMPSAEAPGANGTMMRMDFCGGWARVTAGDSTSANSRNQPRCSIVRLRYPIGAADVTSNAGAAPRNEHASKRPRWSRPLQHARWLAKSDVPALDLLGQLLDQVGDLLELGMQGERAAEGVERVLVVADLLQDHAESGKRAEVARLALEHFVDVGERAGEILLREIDRGAPVPGFDVLGPNVDDGGEQLDREIVVLALHRGLDAAHQQVAGVAAGGDPQRPDAVLDELGALFRGRDLERLEQLVEIELGVAGLGTRQVGRGLDQLGRLAAAGRGRVGLLRGCARRGSHQQRRQENGAESLTHRRESNPPAWRRKGGIASK